MISLIALLMMCDCHFKKSTDCVGPDMLIRLVMTKNHVIVVVARLFLNDNILYQLGLVG